MASGEGHYHRIAAWGVLILVAAAYAAMVARYPLAYVAATYEDLPGEWMQVVLFAATALLALRAGGSSPRFRGFFFLLAAGAFYTVGEEISWGQRLLDLETPAFFDRYNLQQETNLHNLLTGPYDTFSKRATELLLASALLLYGLLYPLALLRGCRGARALEEKGVPAPPLYLWPFFALSAALELRLFRFNEAEIAELLLPFALGVFLLHHLTAVKGRKISRRGSKRLARRTVALFLAAVAASAAITILSWSNPRLRALAQERFYAGVEKFAERYERNGHYGAATALYLAADRRDPGRADILRSLAWCRREAGDEAGFGTFNARALQADLAALAEHPESVSLHLSLAETCEQGGRDVETGEYLRKALRLAEERLGRKPQDPRSFFTLARVHAALGNDEWAVEFFRRAHELEPEDVDYEEAYLESLAWVGENVSARK